MTSYIKNGFEWLESYSMYLLIDNLESRSVILER